MRRPDLRVLLGEPRVLAAERLRFVVEIVAELHHAIALLLEELGRRRERGRRRRDQVHGVARELGIAGLRRLPLRIAQNGASSARFGIAVLLEDAQRLGLRRRVRHGRAGRDRADVVAGHVGDHERRDGRRMRDDGEPAALQARQMLAHAVDLANVGALANQEVRGGAFLLERERRQAAATRATSRRPRSGNRASRRRVAATRARATARRPRGSRCRATDARLRRPRCRRTARPA